jgi:hypothetical protein
VRAPSVAIRERGPVRRQEAASNRAPAGPGRRGLCWCLGCRRSPPTGRPQERTETLLQPSSQLALLSQFLATGQHGVDSMAVLFRRMRAFLHRRTRHPHRGQGVVKGSSIVMSVWARPCSLSWEPRRRFGRKTAGNQMASTPTLRSKPVPPPMAFSPEPRASAYWNWPDVSY